MIKKWIFAAGAGIGYVLGTKAGRERYEKMRMQARQVLENPTVKEATDTVQTEATRLKDGSLQAFRQRMRQLRHRKSAALDQLDEGVSATSAATTALPTTAPSTTAPSTTTPSSATPSNASPAATSRDSATPDYPPRS
jgi:hypothetical protein